MSVHSESLTSQVAVSFQARLSTELASLGTSWHHLGEVRASRPWTVFAARRRLANVIRREGVDVVIAHGDWCHGLLGGVARRYGARLVAMAHAPYGTGHWTQRLAIRQGADLVLANSQFTASSVQRAFRRVPCEVLYPPVAFETGSISVGRSAVRRELGLRDTDIVVLMASRLDPYKGHETLIRAAQTVVKHQTSASIRFVVCGGAQRPADEARFQKLKKLAQEVAAPIIWLGQRSDVSRLMAAADLYCQPNIGPEPLGLVFVEALRAGLPVVTSPIGGAVEVVNDQVGILTEPGNADMVAQAILKLALDILLRTRLCIEARRQGAGLCVPGVQVERLATTLRRHFLVERVAK